MASEDRAHVILVQQGLSLDAGCRGQIECALSSMPSLIEIAFVNQAMSADSNANPFRLVVTSAGAGVVGDL